VSVSDEALSAVLLDHRAPFALDENDARGMLSEADVAKYERGAYMYRELREAVDEEPITRIVSRLWHQFGYRYRLLASPSLHPYLEYFDHLWELARTMDNRPVVEFVDAMRDHLGEYARRPELEVLRDEAPGVQLLTIHKAKGLEFPVVVLANTGNVGRNDGLGKQPFYLSEQFGLTANMSSASARLSKPDRVNYFFTVGQEENAGMELAELKRLLYVALTRAESHILISGVFNRNNRSTDRHLLYHVLSALNLDPQQQRIGRLDSDIDVEVDLIPDVPRSVLSGFGEAPRGPTPTEVLSAYRAAEPVERGSVEREITVTELAERYHEAARAADAEVAARDGGAGAADEELPAVRCEELLEERGLAPFFGSLTHYLIEASLEAGAPGSGAPATGAPPPAELPPGLRREAHRGEVTEEEYLRMAHDAEALATGFLRSPVAARLHGARIESEVPFVLYRSIGETPAWIRGQIDFLADFGGPDGEVLVLDFKTDRRYRPHAHRLQLSLYREAAAELTARGAGPEEQLTRRTVRALVYYLRDGRVEEVEDAPELSEALLGASNTR
jgi:ATP-dependent exoDNAse (exonuclease V) beta subunit